MFSCLISHQKLQSVTRHHLHSVLTDPYYCHMMNSNWFWVLYSLWSPVLSGSLDSSVQTGHLFSTGLNIWIVSWSDGGSELRHNKTSVGAERTHSTWRRRDGTVWMIWVWTTLITVFGLTNETECVESVWRTLLMSEAACSNELGGWRNLKTRLTMFISLYWDEHFGTNQNKMQQSENQKQTEWHRQCGAMMPRDLLHSQLTEISDFILFSLFDRQVEFLVVTSSSSMVYLHQPISSLTTGQDGIIHVHFLQVIKKQTVNIWFTFIWKLASGCNTDVF